MGESQIGEARISTTRKVGKFALIIKCSETSISGVQKHLCSRPSPVGKDGLKICRKCTEEHPGQSVISIRF